MTTLGIMSKQCYAECHVLFIMLKVIMLKVIMLKVIMLSVVMLSVVALYKRRTE